MSKVRVHQLAKELELEPKELIARLEKLGVRGKKAQSSLDEREVAAFRASLAAAEKPQVAVGEEKVVTDRVVTEESQDLGEIQAHETVVERRVRSNVIRRRTSRVEVVVKPPPVEAAATPAPIGEEPPEVSAPEVAPPPVESPPPAREQEAPAVEVEPPEAVPASTPVEPEKPVEPVEEPAARPQEEASRGPRILGRIDLKRKPQPEPSGVSARGAQAEVEPAGREPRGEPTAAGEPVSEPGAADEEKPAKGVRHKKRVIKKDQVFDLREREFRSGRVPKKKRALPGKEQKKTEITVPKASKRVVRVSEAISVADMARIMGVKAGEVIKKLMALGMMATINKMLDADTAALVASDFDYQVENVAFDDATVLEVEHEVEEAGTCLQARPPVVTIMGHVDHGKTSLLDAIRHTDVTGQEAGGITQHIGAYHVRVDGKGVTFLDTPGHEAFTAMRARGAKVTDIVVLVVAADDGVMPQTIEAINHARAAEVPIVVAVNKIDKHDANLDRVKRGLTDQGLVPEDWGGDTIVVPVSAVTKEGVPQLLEMLLLQADILELKANPDKLARGAVIEAKLDRGRGPVATVLIQEGTLRNGDPVVCGVFHGKVRAMIDDQGRQVAEASPSSAVEILGLQGVPQAGEFFSALTDEATARQIAEHRHARLRETELAKSSKVSLEEFYEQVKTGEVKELKVVLKGDVHGSVEALTEAMNRLSSEEVKVRTIHGSVGGITESDVLLAAASNAIVIGFNVRPEAKAGHLAAQERVDVRLYTVIYDALADIRAAMEGMLEPTYREQAQGRVEIREIFNIRGIGTVAGGYVLEGKISRASFIRLLRDQVVVHEGKLASLKRFKDDVREVAVGYECGLSIEGFQDVKVGDVIEACERVPVTRRLTPTSAASDAMSQA